MVRVEGEMITPEQRIKIAADMLQNIVAGCKSEEVAKEVAGVRAFLMQEIRPAIPPTENEYVGQAGDEK